MKITIKDKEIEIKNKMRAYLIYEKLTDKPFNPQSLTELMIYLYSLILSNEPNIHITFDDFIDYIDEHRDIMDQFNDWLIKEAEINGQFADVKKKMEIK